MEPTVFQAFRFDPIGEALKPYVFGARCECGETVFAVSGINLNVDVPEGMDVLAKCKCGLTHSVMQQAEENRKVSEEPQAVTPEVVTPEVVDATVVQ